MLPVILDVFYQFSELSGLNCEEERHSGEQEEERIDTSLKCDKKGGRGDYVGSNTMGYQVRYGQRQAQGLD